MDNKLFTPIADHQSETLCGGGPGYGDGGFSFFAKASDSGFKVGLWTSAFSFFAKFSFGGYKEMTPA